MMVKHTNWLTVASFIALCLSLAPWTLVSSAVKSADFCESLPDEPSHSGEIKVQLQHQLEQFELKNYDDFAEINGDGYRGYCKRLLKDPPRPRQILAAYWLKFNGHWDKIKRFHDECLEDNRKLLISPRELCQLATRKMKAASKQHSRDIQYLLDNVRLSLWIINHRNETNFSDLFYCRQLTIAARI